MAQPVFFFNNSVRIASQMGYKENSKFKAQNAKINYLAAELTRYSVEASLLNAAELRSIYSFVPLSTQ